jgi:RNA polymerase sigma factor (sigma-70 family)
MLAQVMQVGLTSDEHLVDSVRAGSERAFEALCDRYYRPLLAFCRHILGSSADAEDAVQQTFLAAYGDLMRSEKPIALRPWLYTIARHRCVSALRARRERPSDELPERGVDSLAAEVDAREDVRTTFTDLTRLPDDQRAALVLAELGDLSHPEIARILGCRQDKVKALVYQARTSLTADRTARETPCSDIREQLTMVGGALRHTTLRRHVRECPGCRAFGLELRAGRRGLALLVPALWLKRAALGAVSSWGGAGAGALTAGAVGGSGLIATVLVVAAAASGDATPRAGGGAEPAEPARLVTATQPSTEAVRQARPKRAAAVRPRAVVPAGLPDDGDEVAGKQESGAVDGSVAPADACCHTEHSSADEPTTGPAAAPPRDEPTETQPGGADEDTGGGQQAPPHPRVGPPGRERAVPAPGNRGDEHAVTPPQNRGRGQDPGRPDPPAVAPERAAPATPPQANGAPGPPEQSKSPAAPPQRGGPHAELEPARGAAPLRSAEAGLPATAGPQS